MSEPLAIHLMRHGAPTLPGRLLGRTDCPATPAGIAACARAARRLAVEAIVSSDLDRARACGQAAADAHGKALTVDPRWREFDFGAWDGLAAADVDPAALARFWDDPDSAAPPGGERWSALVTRVGEALHALDRPTLVVTHAGAMRAALSAACGFEQRQVWAFDLPYAVTLSLDVWPGEPPTAQITGLAR